MSPGVVEPKTVEQDALTETRARHLQASSAGNLLIVLRDGIFRGILASSERTFAFTDRLLLDMIKQYEQQASKPSDAAASGSSVAEPPRS